MEYPIVEFNRGKPVRNNGENRNQFLICVQWAEDQPAYELRAYTKESEGYKVLRLQATDLVIRKEIMDVAKGLFNESWPFMKEMDEARAVEKVS